MHSCTWCRDSYVTVWRHTYVEATGLFSSLMHFMRRGACSITPYLHDNTIHMSCLHDRPHDRPSMNPSRPDPSQQLSNGHKAYQQIVDRRWCRVIVSMSRNLRHRSHFEGASESSRFPQDRSLAEKASSHRKLGNIE